MKSATQTTLPRRTVGAAWSGARAAVRGAKPALREAWRRALELRGRDVTAETPGRSCLVLAPHFDDETLGCGVTILRKRAAGTRVGVVFATDGRASHRSRVVSPEELGRLRAEEALAACSLLGVPEEHVVLLDLPESQLGEHLGELTRALVEVMVAFNPDEVLVTCALDWLPDHQALNRAARVALATSGLACRLVEYPVWYWADGPWLMRPTGRRLGKYARDFVADFTDSLASLRPERVSTAGLLARKREALWQYQSQITNLTGEPDWATFPDGFLGAFLRPYEIFFPVEPEQGPRHGRSSHPGELS